MAVTLRARSSVTVQVVAGPEQPPPLKPVKALSASGCAVSVTWPPAVIEQSGWADASLPQSMPSVVEST